MMRGAAFFNLLEGCVPLLAVGTGPDTVLQLVMPRARATLTQRLLGPALPVLVDVHVGQLPQAGGDGGDGGCGGGGEQGGSKGAGAGWALGARKALLWRSVKLPTDTELARWLRQVVVAVDDLHAADMAQGDVKGGCGTPMGGARFKCALQRQGGWVAIV
jgi:hypothetical protein